MASTGIMISSSLATKLKQEYGLFDKFSLTVVLACYMDKNPRVFLTRTNQHIQEVNRHFDRNPNCFGPMVFAANQDINKSYTFKDILLQP